MDNLREQLVTVYPSQTVADTSSKNLLKGKSLTILLVDDSVDNHLLINLFLKKTTHHLEVAHNGEEGVCKFKETNYDVVLMDMQMPVMDGNRAIRTIRKWEKENNRKPCTIFAFTASTMPEDTQRALSAGCNAYLTKPLSKTQLLQYIEERVTLH